MNWTRCVELGAIALAMTLGFVSGTAHAAGASPDGELTWLTEWKQAKELALAEQRPILLDFAADWCAPCRAMDRDFWPRPQVREQAERFVLVRVDFDSQAGLRREFMVNTIPNVVVLDPWINTLGLMSGWGGDPTRHLAMLRAVPADFGPLAADAEAASQGKASGDAYERLGEHYFPTILSGVSKEFFEKAAKSRELRSDPARRAMAMAKIGWCELRLDDVASARKSFEKALKLSEANDVALGGLVVAWARLGKLDKAEQTLAELREAFPDSSVVSTAAKVVEAVTLAQGD